MDLDSDPSQDSGNDDENTSTADPAGDYCLKHSYKPQDLIQYYRDTGFDAQFSELAFPDGE